MTEVLTYEALKAERDALADRVNALAVENAELKADRATLAEYWIADGGDEKCAQSYCEETPATSAALAAIEARGVDKLIKLKMEQLANMHPDTHSFGATAESLRAQINELQAFATELREAK